LIFNIARSYERLGKVEDALANYQAYVDAPGTTAEDRSDALNRIKALKQEQAARDATGRDEEPPAPELPAEAKTDGKGRETPLAEREQPKLAASKTNTVTKGADGLVLIVHKNNKISHLTPNQLNDIYLGRMTSWPGGARVRPFGRSANTEAAKSFFTSKTGIDAGKSLHNRSSCQEHVSLHRTSRIRTH
jgi:hypothetical protein